MALDSSSLVVAIISLFASISVAGFSAYMNYTTEQRKAHRDAERLLQKYRDPLLFASEDLQSRIWGLVERDVLNFAHGSDAHKDALYIYTAFVIGQFFAWTHILRRETSLSPFSLEEDQRLRQFVEILHTIQGVMLTDQHSKTEGQAFTMWRGHQMAIGEFMSLRDEGKDAERLCMGFYEFTESWKNKSSPAYETLHYWFRPVETGLEELVVKGGQAPEANRLRRLQHVLLDLIAVLDPSKKRLTTKYLSGCKPAPMCPCATCKANLDPPENPNGSQKTLMEKVFNKV